MADIYLFGCGCQGTARIANAIVYGTAFVNFKAVFPSAGSDDPIFDVTQNAFQATYKTRTTVRVSTSPGTFPNHDGTWTETFNVYTQAITGTPPPSIGTPGAPSYSSDGTVATQVYNSPPNSFADVVTETTTLSNEYTYAAMETDVDALMAAVNWATIGAEVERTFTYEVGTGNIVSSDRAMNPDPDADGAFTQGSYYFANGLNFEKQQIKSQVTTLWRIRVYRTKTDPMDVYAGTWAGLANLESCADYTDTQCSPPHEITISIPTPGASSPEKYTGQNAIQRMVSCSDP